MALILSVVIGTALNSAYYASYHLALATTTAFSVFLFHFTVSFLSIPQAHLYDAPAAISKHADKRFTATCVPADIIVDGKTKNIPR